MTRAEQARQMLKAAVDRYGVLDVAVNNAARAQDTKPIAEMDEGDFDAVQKVDLKGVVLCLKYEILQMMAQGGGARSSISPRSVEFALNPRAPATTRPSMASSD